MLDTILAYRASQRTPSADPSPIGPDYNIQPKVDDPKEPTDKSPGELITMVEQAFNDFQPLHRRMDDDFELYRLKPFKPLDGEAMLEKDAFTDNEPNVLAKQIIAYITSSERQVIVPNKRADEMRREANQALEQFLIGLFNAVDKQFLERADPRLIAQLAAFSSIRGPLVMRRFLRKDEYGETVPDALVMDPRWVVFRRGTNGIRWLCYKIRKERDEVAETYEVAIPKPVDDDHSMYVYDFYYRQNGMFMNCVLGSAGNTWLKPPSIVYTSQFPVVVVGGDDLPMLQSGQTGDSTLAQWAESCFAPNRGVWPVSNRATSYHLALTARAVNQVLKLKSLEGNKVTETNPNVEGGVIPLSVQNQEDIEPMQLSSTTQDAQILAAKLQRSKDSGGLPPHAFGIADPPLSGVAYRQLGARVEHVITPFLVRVQQVLQLAAEGWCRDFKTGFFAPIQVYGVNHTKQPFEMEASPQVLQMAGKPMVMLRPHLPEDTLEKYAVAEKALQNHVVSRRYAQDHIIQIEDAEWVENEIREDIANQATPFAQYLMLSKAALKAGNQDLAFYYKRKAEMELLMERMQLGMMASGGSLQPGGESGPPQNGGPAKGQDPRQLHAQRFGQNANTRSEDAGYATRNPRPGAQNGATRTARQAGVNR